MLGKVKYYARPKNPGKDDVTKMVEFMLSEAGNYSGHKHIAALSALDHARDYAEGDAKNAFWYSVYCRLEYLSLGRDN